MSLEDKLKKGLLWIGGAVAAVPMLLSAQDKIDQEITFTNDKTNEPASGLNVDVYRNYPDFKEFVTSGVTDASGKVHLNDKITSVQNESFVKYGFNNSGFKSVSGPLFFGADRSGEATYTVYDMGNAEELAQGKIQLGQGMNKIDMPNFTAGRRHVIVVEHADKVYRSGFIGNPNIRDVTVSGASGGRLGKGSGVTNDVSFEYVVSSDSFNDTSFVRSVPVGQDLTEDFSVDIRKIPRTFNVDFSFLKPAGMEVDKPVTLTWNGQSYDLGNVNFSGDLEFLNYHNDPSDSVNVSFDNGSEFMRDLVAMYRLGANEVRNRRNIGQFDSPKNDSEKPNVNLAVNDINGQDVDLYTMAQEEQGPDGRVLQYNSEEVRRLIKRGSVDGWNTTWDHKDTIKVFLTYLNDKGEQIPQQDLDESIGVLNDMKNASRLYFNEGQTSAGRLVNWGDVQLVSGYSDPIVQEHFAKNGTNNFVYAFTSTSGTGGNSIFYNSDASVRAAEIKFTTESNRGIKIEEALAGMYVLQDSDENVHRYYDTPLMDNFTRWRQMKENFTKMFNDVGAEGSYKVTLPDEFEKPESNGVNFEYDHKEN